MSAIPLSEVQYQQEHIHESRSELLIVVSTVICGLALLSFVLRLVARYAKGAPLGLDDWLSIGSAISLAGMAICVGLVAHYGIGKHLLLVLETPGRITEIGKTQLALTTLYVFAMTFGKLSVLALFARIFTLASRTFRLAIYFFVIVTILWFAANILTIYLQCRPLSTLWGDPHSCLTSEASGVVLGAVNAVADIGILILPQRMIWDLRLSLRRRVAVSGVFLVGGFSTIISIVRIPTLFNVSAYDSTFTTVNGLLFTALEAATVLLCSCLPVVPGFFALFEAGRSAQHAIGSQNTGSVPTQSRGSKRYRAPNSSRIKSHISARQGSSESTEQFTLDFIPGPSGGTTGGAARHEEV